MKHWCNDCQDAREHRIDWQDDIIKEYDNEDKPYKIICCECEKETEML
jgi:hypothetical protein